MPNYTNQTMNRDLKELCKLAEINEPIRITSYKGNVRIDDVEFPDENQRIDLKLSIN